MAFDTDTYICDLAAVHGLAPKPGDTDRADLISRAVRAELDDIKARTQALHDWSAAVVADHDGAQPHTAATTVAGAAQRRSRPARRRPASRPAARPQH
ncbi:hypothetical protein KGQ20_37130 [Catenulispora sp. NF23]|uniref:hypothetical protein n=1 Tax=Catenulispora pinistramenti TaxID=2705254 RepID=UPI001BAB2A76|nr:hypothetical protein [Catenulispora pinistramenti]MBS2538389.1 hypothetical protein [Catenulispora pinistramenti]